MEKKTLFYDTPQTEIIEIENESVLCASGTGEEGNPEPF